MTGGAGFVTMGHHVLFETGSLKLTLNIPLDRVNGLIDLPEEELSTGPEVRPDVIQFILAVT
jgi:hypothetical protein